MGRAVGLVESGPLLPFHDRRPPSPSPPTSPTVTDDSRLPADRLLGTVEAGRASPSVWIQVDRLYPFCANPLTGAALGSV